MPNSYAPTKTHVTGGNVHRMETRRNQNKAIYGSIAVAFFFALTAMILIGVIITVFTGSELNNEKITVAIANTQINLDRALAHNPNPEKIFATPKRYLDRTSTGITLTVTPGSCGSTANNAYTIAGRDRAGNIAVYTTKTNATVNGNAAQQAALLREVCES